jgi:ankyrin repeat protein
MLDRLLENSLKNAASSAKVRVFDLVNAEDDYENSLLSMAVEMEDRDAVIFFIKNGAKNYSELASENPDIVRILQRAEIIDIRRESVLKMAQKNNKKSLKIAIDLKKRSR